MPQFVIQHHQRQGQPEHWDLMFESGQVLKTFQLDRPPAHAGLLPAQAVPIFDHELRFLTYEGPVNQGQGQVTLADQGTYQSLQQTEGLWEFTLDGTILQGRFILEQVDANQWRLYRS